MNIVNFVASQISKNTRPRTFIDLGNIIEYSKIILNNSDTNNSDTNNSNTNNSDALIDYLNLYEEHQYIDLDFNNFSNIKIKIINDGILIDRSNFNKLINRIINQKIQDKNNQI
ncbi:19231_t:CDS:1, partial [Gigaspora margarita]